MLAASMAKACLARVYFMLLPGSLRRHAKRWFNMLKLSAKFVVSFRHVSRDFA